ncbi:MAG: thiamine pyrophosphate-binding protein [Verrucomicrobiota bacterium]|nr:thiamine pyrophosphate-binding protein [Verrucomicrobiota bacterium]
MSKRPKTPSRTNVADQTCDMLRRLGIERVYIYPGGTIVPLINGCIKYGIKIETFKSEQGAGYAALARARLTGKPQVVMVTSGPGVTNILTPLADAFYDSTPLVLICGQISTKDLNERLKVRQRGFQEVPTTRITEPLSKQSKCFLTIEDVVKQIPEAFDHTLSGRKGPVVLDFPMDLQLQQVSVVEQGEISIELFPEIQLPEKGLIEEVFEHAITAKRAVILLGQGALQTAAFQEYLDIAEKMDAMVVTSLLGVGSFDVNHERCLGYLGHTGHQAANLAVFESDFLLVLGSRLDVRQTGTVVEKFAHQGQLAWIDTDADELSHPRVAVRWKIQTTVRAFCDAFLQIIPEQSIPSDVKWQSRLLSLKRKRMEDQPLTSSVHLQPRRVMDQLTKLIGESRCIVVTGVGCHQHWAARHLPYSPEKCRLLTSGGHGAMGYDLPTSIGAAMTYPDQRVLCVVGDGSLLMNIQELATLSERNLGVKIILFNNRRLGIVSQFQLISFATDPTTGHLKTPDFVAIARGFGLHADRLEVPSDLKQKLDWLWNLEGPALLEINIDPEADIVPMLLAGKTMDAMWTGRKT